MTSRIDVWNDRWNQRWGRRARIARALVVLLLLLVSAFSVGDTFGLFSAGLGAGGTNSFTAGTLTLTEDPTSVCTAGAGNVAPGDSGTCTWTTTYSGTVAAYVAVNVTVQTQAGTGGTNLYTPSDPTHGLTLTVTDNQGTPVTYTVPTLPTTCAPTAPATSICYELDNLLVRTTSLTTGTAITFTTAWSLPLAAGNGYQGGQAQVILVSHAVQESNNTLVCSSPPATAGHACSPGVGFTWA